MTSRKDAMLHKTRYLKAFGNEGLKHVELWFLSLYLDRSKPTFLDKTVTVATMFPDRDRRFQQAFGNRLRSLLDPYIEKWLDEEGMSVTRVKEHLFRLVNAKQTKFQKIKGAVEGSDLGEGVRVVAKGTGSGKYNDVETLIAIDTENLDLQSRVVENLMKMKGMSQPEKVEVVGLGDIVAKLQEAQERAKGYEQDLIEVKPTYRSETITEEGDSFDILGDDDEDSFDIVG